MAESCPAVVASTPMARSARAAITSKRVYKAAYDAGIARGIILGESETHFDPRIVEAFAQIEDQFDAIRTAHMEDVVVESGPVPVATGRSS